MHSHDFPLPRWSRTLPVQIKRDAGSAATRRAPLADQIDNNGTHDVRGVAEKVAAVLDLKITNPLKSQVCLVDQGSGANECRRLGAPQPIMGQPAQVVV